MCQYDFCSLFSWHVFGNIVSFYSVVLGEVPPSFFVLQTRSRYGTYAGSIVATTMVLIVLYLFASKINHVLHLRLTSSHLHNTSILLQTIFPFWNEAVVVSIFCCDYKMSSQDCVCNQLLPEWICCSYGCRLLMSHQSMPSANYSLDGSVGASIMGSFWYQLYKEVWIFIGKDSWTIIFLVFFLVEMLT
jgi:hypothetical protein